VIAAPSIVVIITLISMRADYLSQTSERFAARVQEAAQPMSVKNVRINGTVVRAYEQPGPVLGYPYPSITADYERAKPGDKISLSLSKRYAPDTTTGSFVGNCKSDQLPQRGEWKCQWSNRLPEGDYFIDLFGGKNLGALGRFYFSIKTGRPE
jgi:hypothetical protein